MPKVLMCPPDYFDVKYSINAWMDVNNKVDTARARQQWQALINTYQSLGYEIKIIDPVDGLPDMVFATDNGLAIGQKVVLGRFLYSERMRETRQYKNWFKTYNFETLLPSTVFEGGDVRVAGKTIFIGYGFRTAKAAHVEIAQFFDRPVVSLHLVDKRFYHMDTAFCPLDESTAMYFPAAFDEPSRELIKSHFENLIEVSESDALEFGLNSYCDGKNVITSAKGALIETLKAKDYNPITIDISEFKKSGGGINCLTLELRA